MWSWYHEQEGLVEFIYHLRQYRHAMIKLQQSKQYNAELHYNVRIEMATIHGYLGGISVYSYRFQKKLRFIWNKLYSHLNKKD